MAYSVTVSITPDLVERLHGKIDEIQAAVQQAFTSAAGLHADDVTLTFGEPVRLVVHPTGGLELTPGQLAQVQKQLEPTLLDQSPMKDLIAGNGVLVVLSPVQNQPRALE
jgi:hypothetical protein